jgi:large subunit ribosomal protein L6
LLKYSSMSKIGKEPIDIPQNVKVTVDGRKILVEGPKGKLEYDLPREISGENKDDQFIVSRKKETDRAKALHGTSRAVISNMVKGVSDGWAKTLELVGIGYRADTTGKILNLTVGYSHPVEVKAPEGITFKVEKSNITVEGSDKVLVGEVAAKIRAARPPEPYKGKGIKYIDEVIRRKAGKAAKTAA